MADNLPNPRDAFEVLRAFLVYVPTAGEHINKPQLQEHLIATFGPQRIEIMGTIAEEWVEDGRKGGLEIGLEKGRIEVLKLSRSAESIDELVAFIDRQQP